MVHPFVAAVRRFAPLAEARGVPGAVLVAQAVLETGWGRSGLARLGGAWFGIKAGPAWDGRVYSGTTREWSDGRPTLIPGRHRVYPTREDALADGADPRTLFRAYEDVADNVRDYLRFFHVNPRYHRALRAYAATGNPRRFVVEIAAAGYATDPGYAGRLLALMQQVAPDLLPARPFSVRLLGRPLPPDAVLLRGRRLYLRLRTLAGLLGWRIAVDPVRKAVRITAGRPSRPGQAADHDEEAAHHDEEAAR